MSGLIAYMLFLPFQLFSLLSSRLFVLFHCYYASTAYAMPYEHIWHYYAMSAVVVSGSAGGAMLLQKEERFLFSVAEHYY